jgi:hypothetical protein
MYIIVSLHFFVLYFVIFSQHLSLFAVHKSHFVYFTLVSLELCLLFLFSYYK